MQETDLRAFVANCLKQDCTRFFSPGKFLQEQSATWKVFVFSAPAGLRVSRYTQFVDGHWKIF